MPRRCAITGRVPMKGRSYSIRGIAKKKKGIGLKVTGIKKRRFNPNLIKKRVWLSDEKRFVTLRLSTQGLRLIDKHGVSAVVKKLRASGHSI